MPRIRYVLEATREAYFLLQSRVSAVLNPMTADLKLRAWEEHECPSGHESSSQLGSPPRAKSSV